MGGKQTGAGKQIHFCIALVILLVLAGCTPARQVATTTVNSGDGGVKKNDIVTIVMHLGSARKLFGERAFGPALREYEKVLSGSAPGLESDEALLFMGLIYAHPGNPDRAAGKASTYFRRLSEGPRRNIYSEQARMMLAIMKEGNDTNRTLEKQKTLIDDSNRTIEKLKALIEAAKRVDIEIEEKKRDKAQ